MNKKLKLPVVVSVLLLLIGIVILYSINKSWSGEEITVNNPGINKVESNPKSLDLKSIIHETEKSVVQIEGQSEDATITGSGFLYNNKGDIITNAHVVNDAEAIYVKTANAHTYPAAIIGVGKKLDVAVVRVPQLADQSPLDIAEDSQAEIGDEVIALGSPHGFQNTVTLGIISGMARNFSVDGFAYNNVYQISAQITHGNSGGPLINRETGKVIGINSVGTEDGTIGFSIPIEQVIDKVTKWSKEANSKKLDFANVDDIISNSDPDDLTKNAEYLADYFFESITIRDYVTAYSLLGSSMQTSTSYSDFRNGYIHIIDLDYASLSSNITDGNQVKISANITVETKSTGKNESKKHKQQYVLTIGSENNQLKIQNITRGKK
ncbi:S1C family serine protease [Virgibacillus siamensis]|uniref:S1C family serine protease n=1 Tax=Virgibacillus siamensis TaxID=480071 RepID=UPI0009841045|nr:trypsin-like peptidase domain-containing protein [Virgibacillus siamensis]